MTWQRILIDGSLQRRFVPTLSTQLPAFKFDQQRSQCEACARSSVATSLADDYEITLLHCSLTHHLPASFARLPDGLCGPDGAQFMPKEAPHGQL